MKIRALATILVALWGAAGCAARDPEGDPTEASDGGLPDASLNHDYCARQEIADAGAPGLCAPGGQGPHWLTEGETLAIRIGCDRDFEAEPGEFTVGVLPPGAVYDSATATLTWTPGLDQAAVYEVEVGLPRVGETGRVKIGVADKWNDPDNVPIIDPTRYPEEYGLPVFFLLKNPTGDDEYEEVSIVYRGHVYYAEAKLRGVSSLSFPKKSYALKFREDDRFSDPDAACGFMNKRKVSLTTTFDDNSYLRQRLGFELWNRLDPGNLPIQAYSAVVYLEGQYWGLYTVTDHVDEYLMASFGLNEEGNLYKALGHSCDFGPDVSEFEKKHPEPKSGEPLSKTHADLMELVEFIDRADDDRFRREISSRIHLRDYENWWIFVMYTDAADSAGKNAYHYHDPNGGLWRYLPWDLNWSFGQDWATFRRPSDPDDDYTQWNRIFERLLEDPVIGLRLRDRLIETVENQYDPEEVDALLDRFAREIDASARRDGERWRDAYLSFGRWKERTNVNDYREEIAYVRSWIETRASDIRRRLF